MKASSCLWLGLTLLVGAAEAQDSRATRKLFETPPREFATAPLWVWNDRLTEDQIRGTMRDLAGQDVRQVFVHPRPGLMTPYLSDEWFHLWRVALAEAKRLDMNVWIYDENSYPSGFAGGWVPELMPESRGRGLHFREVSKPEWNGNTLGVYRLLEGAAELIERPADGAVALPEGLYLVAEVRRAGNSPWHGNRSYVDLLYPGVTEKFIEVTLDAYEREIGKEFGRRVPGIFSDEPEIQPAGGLPWTEDVPEQFEQRWGYPLVPQLAGLNREVGDWRRVRHNLFQTLLDLFVERWAKPYYERCEELGLEFTGHYWEHNWPNCVGGPDNMAMAAWQQRPGIDILMNQYAENTHAQFGNVRACREIASIANQLGRPRTLVEIYGAGGWDLRFEDMKRIGDWLQVLGVNTLDEHLSYITLRGARKRDHPQSFSYHEPWWDSYHTMARYFTRLSAALSQGQQINPVLVLEPTTTAWMYQGKGEALRPLGDEFFNLLMRLERAQVPYDLASEDVLKTHGSFGASPVNDGSDMRGGLRVGQRTYPVVVLPPHNENLNARTAELLKGFLKSGGVVLSCGPAPERLDGKVTPELADLAAMSGWKTVAVDALTAALEPFVGTDGFRIVRDDADGGILFHQRRRLKDGELVFLVNTSIEQPARGTVYARRGGFEEWDPYTGAVDRAHFERDDTGIRYRFELPPCGSRLLFLSNRDLEAAEPDAGRAVRALRVRGVVEVERLEPNVLTLDYLDITAGGATLTNSYFYDAQQFAFRQNGMDRNPWDSAVQFKDELITKTFPAESGFTASYRFVIEGAVPDDIEVVVERPDLYGITCNGRPLLGWPERWWLDRAFGRLGLDDVAHTGTNVLTLVARPFTIEHELEPVYLRGRFALKGTDRGFVITSDSGIQGPTPKGWSQQGHPFYSGPVSYRQRFTVEELSGEFRVAVPEWYGSVATVRVNGGPVGTLVAAPWECEVTEQIHRGTNVVEVVVVGTLKNTLGPHHANPGRGSAWPSMFHRSPKEGQPPGEQYDTIAYGLFAPVELRQTR